MKNRGSVFIDRFGSKVICFLIGLAFFLAGCVATPADEKPLRLFSPSSELRDSSDYFSRSNDGMVAAAHPMASAAGSQMLKIGGNAIDAAVAASFVISVVRPQSTGLGGGGFLLHHDAEKRRQRVFDFRERAPGKASPKMFLDDQGKYKTVRYAGKIVPNPAVNGHLSVAIPGLVKGLLDIHKSGGVLPLSTVLAPAVSAAELGFQVYPSLARDILNRKDMLEIFPASRDIFLPNGRPLKAGELLVQKDLAKTLRAIIRDGSYVFYEGAIAEKIAAEMKRGNGILSLSDLKNYKVIERIPVSGRYRDFKIVSMPPPSSGGAHIIQMLNMLESFDISSMRPQGSTYIHLMAEVMRRAFADRAKEMGDSDFVDVPVARLTSRRYARQLMQSFKPEHASRSSDFGITAPAGESPSTTHISVVDKWGNAVSTTQTVNYSFGSCVVAKGTGIVLNDEMDDFTTRPGAQNVFGLITGEKNDIQPRKTPLSSMSPTFVFDGKGSFVMAVGSPGGPRIINATLQTIINVIDFKMPLLAAVHAARVHHQWMPDTIYLESASLDSETRGTLLSYGHQLTAIEAIGDVQAVQRLPDGTLVGVSDSRGDGKPSGP